MNYKNYFISEIKNFLGPPRQNYEIFLLNFLGFQVLRYLFAFIKFKLFNLSKKKTKEGQSLERNGYVVIKNFLNDDDFNYVINVCQKIENEKKFKIKNYGKKEVHSLDFFENDEKKDLDISQVKNIFLEKLINSEIINDVFKILKIDKKQFQNLSYEKIIVGKNFIDDGDEDSQFHSDRFYPCIKIFYYLNDNKTENGAFEYISKSHKFTLKRVVHEYLYSLLICGKKIFKSLILLFDYELKNNRITFSSKKIKNLYGLNSIVVCEAPKNSLIICNNKGFHKRGTLNSNTSRTHLRMNLYDLQISSIKNYLLNFAKKIKKI
jgi:hypothetical protein